MQHARLPIKIKLVSFSNGHHVARLLDGSFPQTFLEEGETLGGAVERLHGEVFANREHILTQCGAFHMTEENVILFIFQCTVSKPDIIREGGEWVNYENANGWTQEDTFCLRKAITA